MVRRPICPPLLVRLTFTAVNLGVVIVLFFQCMGALFSPVNRAKGIKWGLVVHSAAMFLFVTVYTATGLDLQSISYINNREFPGIDGVLSPGPLGYQFLIYSNVINVIPTLMFQFNNWLADGLLVSHVSNSIAHVSNVCSPSSTVAMLFMA